MQFQLLTLKGRLDIDPRSIGRQAQQIGVVVPGAQGRGKQHAAAGSTQSRANEGGRYHIAQTELRQAPSALLAQTDIEQEMLVEQFADTGKLQQLEVEPLEFAIQPLRVVIEIVADGRGAQGNGHQQFARCLVVGLIAGKLLLVQGIPFAIESLQCFLQRFRGVFAQLPEGLLIEAGAVHLAPPLHQIVGLVHQGRHPPLGWPGPGRTTAR